MPNSHTLQLNAEPYNAIISGKKTIESRLYDEKRRLIKIGDHITFINKDDPRKFIEVKVTQLHKHRSFEEMFNAHDVQKFGRENAVLLVNQINQFYTREQQDIYGVLGIEFRLVV